MQFNMKRIGRRIADLRKAQNLTQMNLADQMGISYQAVSNWERGETMPDISKLPELAAIFDCSIDDILGSPRASEVVEYVTGGNAPVEAITGEEVLDLAPLLEPQTTARLIEESGQGREVAAFELHDLVELAPFVESSFLGEQLLKSPLEVLTADILAQAAPFLDEEHLDLIADRLLASGQKVCLDQLTMLAPFLSEAKLDQVVDKFVESGQGMYLDHLVPLAPFLSEAKLGQLVDKFVESGQGMYLDHLVPLAPFLSRAKLDQLVDKFIASDQKVYLEYLPSLAPFLGQDKLDQLFIQALADQNIHEDILVSLAPFISQNVLEQSLLDNLDSLKSKKLLVKLAPFVDGKVLQFLLTHQGEEED